MKKSPFYYLNLNQGAVMSGGKPWHTPAQFTDVLEEYNAVRTACGVTDWSTMCKFDIKGPDAKTFLQKMIVNDINRLTPGRGLYSCMCNEQGGMYDDTTVYQYAEDHYLLVGSTAGRAKDAKRFAAYSRGMRVYITDVTGGFGLLSVQGPNTRKLLNSVSSETVDDVAYFAFKMIQIAGHDVMASRTGFTGELGFELFIAAEDCPCVYEAILEAGKDCGLKPVGLLAASGMLRLEKGYLSGKEYSESINPYEAGVGWSVKLDTDFIGRDALADLKQRGPAKRLMGFIMDGKDKVAPAGGQVLADGASAGQVTAATYSPVLDRSLGLAYIDAAYAVEGAEVTIPVDGVPAAAKLCSKTMYDPENIRLKA